jgi:hypothetical protein
MRKRIVKIVILLILTLLFLFIYSDSGNRQRMSQFAEKTFCLRTPVIEAQRGEKWCWAASTQNVLASYGIRKTQEEIVRVTYGAVVDSAANVLQVYENLLSYNRELDTLGLVIYPLVMPGAPNPLFLIRELVFERSPLMVALGVPGEMGHMVVCCGVAYIKSDSMLRLTKIIIRDPSNGQTKVYPAELFFIFWRATIIVRVAPRPPTGFDLEGDHFTVTPDFKVLDRDNEPVGILWYFNSDKSWHLISRYGADVCAIKK